MRYDKTLIIAAGLLGAVIGDGNRYNIAANNIIPRYLPQAAKSIVYDSIGTVSGELTGTAIMRLLLEYARRRETQGKKNATQL